MVSVVGLVCIVSLFVAVLVVWFGYAVAHIQKDAITYLHNHFRYGKTLLKWFEEKTDNQEVIESHWKYFKKYLVEYLEIKMDPRKPEEDKIKEYSESLLPDAMKDEFKIWKKGRKK